MSCPVCAAPAEPGNPLHTQSPAVTVCGSCGSRLIRYGTEEAGFRYEPEEPGSPVCAVDHPKRHPCRRCATWTIPPAIYCVFCAEELARRGVAGLAPDPAAKRAAPSGRPAQRPEPKEPPPAAPTPAPAPAAILPGDVVELGRDDNRRVGVVRAVEPSARGVHAIVYEPRDGGGFRAAAQPVAQLVRLNLPRAVEDEIRLSVRLDRRGEHIHPQWAAEHVRCKCGALRTTAERELFTKLCTACAGAEVMALRGAREAIADAVGGAAGEGCPA